MKLLSAKIKAFGCLKNYEINFSDGLNVVREDNGFGKTTVANFIKAMFYGINYSRSKQINQNEYKLFKPFNSTEKFGGILRFSHKGSNFRIERYFGATAKEQEARLYDDDTNKAYKIETGDPSKELGARIFGVDADTFSRLVYLPQCEVAITSNDDFVKRLSQLEENTADDNNFATADKALREFCKELRLEKGNGGKLYVLERRQKELQEKFVAAVNEEKKARELSDKIIDDVNKINATEKIIVEADAAVEKYTKQAEKYSGAKELAQYKAALREVSAEYAKTLSKKEENQKFADGFKAQKADLPKKEQPCPPPPPQKAKMPAWQIVVGIILVVAGAALCAVKWYVGVPVAVLGAIFVAVCRAGVAKKQKETWETAQKNYERQQKEYDEWLMWRQNQEAYLTEKIDSLGREVYIAQGSLDALAKRKQELAARIAEFGDENEDIEQLYAAAQKSKADAERARNSYVEKRNEQERVFYADKREYDVLSKNLVDSADVKNEVDGVKQEYEEAKQKYEVALLARKLLAEAKEKLTNDYLPKLNKQFNEYFKLLTDGKWGDATVDAAFEVRVAQGGVLAESGFLSEGYKDMCNFALRLALMKCIYGDDLPLLILDDPFVNYDDKNLATAAKFIKEFAKKTQTLYFTCHDSF